MSRVFIFTGPTLDEETVKELLPSAEVYPPVAAGDLLRLSLVAGDLVAIIDGFYFQSASVRHKEILDLLQCGIHVWGAGSMGALRATELAPFGMRGFGSVFQAYCHGEIDGDDEVAVLHAPQDMRYLKLTEALVNIRSACRTAVVESLLLEEQAQLIVRIASNLPFFERSYPQIWQKVSEAGLSEDVVKTLQTFMVQKRHDIKSRDALEMLQAIPQFLEGPFQVPFHIHETFLLRDWKVDEKGTLLKDQWIADRNVLAAYQLFGEDYPQVHQDRLTGQLAKIALNAHVLAEEPDPFLALSQKEQIAHFFFTHYAFPSDGDLPENALSWLYPQERHLARAEQLVLLGVRLWHISRSQDWQEGMINYLKTTELYRDLVKIVYQTRQFNQRFQEQHHTLHLEHISPEKVRIWAMQRWNLSESAFEIALLDRGFKSFNAFLLSARTFYLFDKYVGVPRYILSPMVSVG